MIEGMSGLDMSETVYQLERSKHNSGDPRVGLMIALMTGNFEKLAANGVNYKDPKVEEAVLLGQDLPSRNRGGKNG